MRTFGVLGHQVQRTTESLTEMINWITIIIEFYFYVTRIRIVDFAIAMIYF